MEDIKTILFHLIIFYYFEMLFFQTDVCVHIDSHNFYANCLVYDVRSISNHSRDTSWDQVPGAIIIFIGSVEGGSSKGH